MNTGAVLPMFYRTGNGQRLHAAHSNTAGVTMQGLAWSITPWRAPIEATPSLEATAAIAAKTIA